MVQDFITRLIAKWGVMKSAELVLLALAASSITLFIGASLISNEPNEEKENDYESKYDY